MRNQQSGFPTKLDKNRPVQSQKQARTLKIWILKEEEMYYLCRENNGADQLCSNCTADLRLLFSHMQIVCGSIALMIYHTSHKFPYVTFL